MAETFEKETALAHLEPSSGGGQTAVRLSECALRGRINLRGVASDPAFTAAVAGVVGIEPPLEPNTARRGGDVAILWLGPDEWLVETDAAKEAEQAAALTTALDTLFAAATVVGDASTTLSLAGPRAADVLAKGMTLDLDPATFQPGQCARSLLGKAGVLLHRPGDDIAYEITVGRSFADYVWRWLDDAALEYGSDPGS